MNRKSISDGYGFGFEHDSTADGENDFDGDGVSNADEMVAGTNPVDNLSVEVPLEVVLVADAAVTPVTLNWDAAPLGEYQVQYADSLDEWVDSPTGLLWAGVAGGGMTWTGDGPPATYQVPGDVVKRFSRVVRCR